MIVATAMIVFRRGIADSLLRLGPEAPIFETRFQDWLPGNPLTWAARWALRISGRAIVSMVREMVQLSEQAYDVSSWCSAKPTRLALGNAAIYVSQAGGRYRSR